jgi:hypothetical protein
MMTRLSKPPLFIMFATTMFFISASVAYSQVEPTSNCDRSTVGQTKQFTGCDRSARVIEIDTYECISLINGAYKWEHRQARHTMQSC